MPKRDLVDIAAFLFVIVALAVVAFLFLGTDISVYLEQHPPGGAI
jgi:hypothetical protein